MWTESFRSFECYHWAANSIKYSVQLHHTTVVDQSHCAWNQRMAVMISCKKEHLIFFFLFQVRTMHGLDLKHALSCCLCLSKNWNICINHQSFKKAIIYSLCVKPNDSSTLPFQIQSPKAENANTLPCKSRYRFFKPYNQLCNVIIRPQESKPAGQIFCLLCHL